MYPDRTLEGAWIFNIHDEKKTTYAYPKPAPNDRSEPPLPTPSEDYPAGGYPWNVKEAIGAGPLILKDSKYYNGKYELFSDDILYYRHPRSAVCKTKNNKLIFFVADGRQSFS